MLTNDCLKNLEPKSVMGNFGFENNGLVVVKSFDYLPRFVVLHHLLQLPRRFFHLKFGQIDEIGDKDAHQIVSIRRISPLDRLWVDSLFLLEFV